MNLAGKYRRKDRIAGRQIAGETFLIPICGTPLEMENIFVLNPLADFIWQRLDGERMLSEVVAEIVAEFDTSAEKAGSDAIDFVGRLLQNGLIEKRA